MLFLESKKPMEACAKEVRLTILNNYTGHYIYLNSLFTGYCPYCYLCRTYHSLKHFKVSQKILMKYFLGTCSYICIKHIFLDEPFNIVFTPFSTYAHLTALSAQ